jgi:outer membrane lipoprotein-sorting protein
VKNIKPRFAILALGAGLALALIGSSIAQSSVADILKQTQANLEKSSWQATVFGNFKTNGGTQEAEVGIQVIPGADATMRMEFKKPGAMEGNFTILSNKEAWNYLFVSNQLVIEPRANAKLNELAQQISSLGDVKGLDDQFNLKLEGEEKTADGTAWKLSGTPKKSGQRFASVTVLILKSDPRPLILMLNDASAKVIGTLDIRNFKRAKLTAKELMNYPSDAAVVRK